MIILDAYALMALLANEPAAEEVGRLISAGSSAVPVPNLAEAADKLGRLHGIAVERTQTMIETLEQSTALRILPFDRREAWIAAQLRVRHYHRAARPLSLGDCLLLAATAEEDRVASSDSHVLDVAATEGRGWIALPDSRGQRHRPG